MLQDAALRGPNADWDGDSVAERVLALKHFAERRVQELQRRLRSLRLLVLVVVFVVVDDDVLEGFNVFEQRLKALVPLSSGFMQKH
jgi:hypothetical protein